MAEPPRGDGPQAKLRALPARALAVSGDPGLLLRVLESLFEGAAVLLASRDSAGGIEGFQWRLVTEGAARLCGRSRESLIGRTLAAGDLPIAEPELQASLVAVVERFETREWPLEAAGPSSQEAGVRVRATRLEGGIVLIFGRATATPSWPPELAEALPLPLCLIREGLVAAANPAWRSLGQDPGQMLGRRAAELVAADQAVPLAAALAQALAAGQSALEVGLPAAGARPRPHALDLRRLGGDLTLLLVRDLAADQVPGERLAARARRLQGALEALPDAVALFDRKLRLVLSNADFLRLFPGAEPGDRAESVLRAGAGAGPFATAAVLEDPERWVTLRLQRLREAAGNFGEEQLADGRKLLWSWHRDAEQGVVTVLSDVTSQRRAEQRLVDAIESIQGGVAVWDADDRLVICNSQYRELYSGAAIVLRPGLSLRELLQAAARSGRYTIEGSTEAWVRGRLAQHHAASGFSEQHYADGRIYLVSQRRTAEGGVVALHADITERKRREQELLRLSRTDPLTGACNRRYFMELARREVRRAGRYQKPLALLAMDLDHFKRVNDQHGHAAGDAALRHFVSQARSTLREVDLLGRLGGEEFAALLPETPGEQAMHAAERVRQRLAASPLSWAGAALPLSVSIGVAELGRDENEVTAALQRADRALYLAKSQGRNRSVLAAVEAAGGR